MPIKTSRKTDDLKKIVRKHGLRLNDVFADAKEAMEDSGERIKEAVNQFDTEDDREAARLSEMENILIEAEVLEEPKQFDPPAPENDLEFLDGLLEGVQTDDEEYDE